MSIRILLFLLAFVVISNLIISLVGLVFGVNMYKTYGKQIFIGYSVFGLLVMVAFVVMAIMGLV